MDASTPPPDLRVPGFQGMLARTLSSSPCTRWILPARIRSPLKHDIVFVGDSSIHLREFIAEGEPHLAEVSSSINFDAQILAADIISATAEVVNSDEQIVNQSVEHVKFNIGGRPVKAGEPAQFLVLSTSKSELIFIYARDDVDGTVRFVHGIRPMFSGVGLRDQQGLHLAHDPESRALAVAPNRDLCVVCSLHPLDQLKHEVDQWRPARENLRPFREQRYIQVDGNIIRMDFLQPPRDDKDKVILVLIVAKQGCAYMLLYRWDANSPLHRIKPMRSSGQELPKEDKMPLMLIPCNAPASFLLVTETELVLYNRVTHSEAKRTAHDLSDRHEFKDGRRTKMWTQWAKPRRTECFRRQNDEIMLVREDGTLRSYDIDVRSDLQVKTIWSPGRLDISMDTAFCTLPAPLDIQGGDIVIAGGSITDGGVFHLQSRLQPRLLQRIPNGTPSNDLLLLPPTVTRDARLDRRSRIFTCCGSHQGGGGLAEIKHGLGAEIEWTMPHPDIASLQRIWSLVDKFNSQVLLFSSHPFHSSLFTLDMASNELDEQPAERYPGINLDASSLEIDILEEDVLVQITPSEMNVVSLRGNAPPFKHSFGTLSILCADTDTRTGTVVAVHETEGGAFAVSICSVTGIPRPSMRADGESLPLDHRPTCVCVSTIGTELFAIVANERGEMVIIQIETHGTAAARSVSQLTSLASSVKDTSVNSMCLLSRPGGAVGLLICGLRNGCLICIELAADKSHNGQLKGKLLSTTRPTRISVNVCVDEESRQGGHVSAAFVSYGHTLERVSMIPNAAGAEYEQSLVIVHSRNMPPEPLDSISAVSRMPRLTSDQSGQTSGLLVCATASEVTFSLLANQTKAVSRRLPITGSPHTVIHSKFLKCLIVGVNPLLGGPTSSKHNRKAPKLCFASIDADDADCTAFDDGKTIILGEPGERISALTHYSPTDDRHHFEMMLVALQSSTSVESGRLKISSRILCISDKHVVKGSATPRVVMRLPGKRVTALCPIGKAGLLIGSNNEILLHSLDVGTKKWATLTRHALPSPAKQIRVQGSVIYVATEKHSLLILKENNNSLSIQSSDTQARIVSNVLPLHRHNIIIADNTANGTQLSGIIEDAQGTTLHRTFQLQVPHLLERLEQDRADVNRSTLIGNALDGTFYSFSTLNTNEWLLCYFLEGLTKHGMKLGATRIRDELDLSSWLGSAKSKLLPTYMGINGDVMARMLEPGAYYLRTLLEPSVKSESGAPDSTRPKNDDPQARLSTLKKLLSRVTDHVSEVDVVGSALIWLRGLLRT